MTIKDFRSIELDREGLMDAVSRCRKVSDALGIPGGRVTDVVFLVPGNEAELRIRPPSGAEVGMTISSRPLAALVIAYLIANKVPIPKQATKSIYVVEGGVRMTFESSVPTIGTAGPAATSPLPKAMDWSA
jgi:hypothetical protein